MAAKVTGTKPAAAPRRTPARQPLGPPPRNAEEAAALRGGPGRARLDGGEDEVMEPGVFGFEPVRLTPVEDETPRVPLFYIADQAYTIPAQVGVEVGLEALHISRTIGMTGAPREEVEGAIYDYIFEATLGPEGYAALRGFRGLRPEDFAKIAAIAYRMTLGALELPKDAATG